jgi:O-antigen/teichoic acid export membrane protein
MSLAIVAYGVTKLAGTLLLFWIGFSVEAALIANVLATVGGLAYLMPRLGLRLSWPNRDALRPIIALSAPIAVLVVTMQLLLSAHLWILKRIGTGSAETLGHYIAALNIAQLPSIVPAALGVVVLSSVALALGRQDAALARRHAASACRFVLLTLAPVCVLGAQQATAIMQLLYSEAYRAGGLYLGILLGGYGLFALLDTMLHALIGADRHRLATGLLLVLVPAVFLTGAALVGTWGATGAAASFLATFALGNVLATIAVYRRFGILPFRAVTVLRVAIATAAAALAGHFLVAEGIAVLLELGFLSAIYFAVLLLLREVSLRDLTHLAVWRRQSRP